jgi:thiol-disulfide isomerase/thioredoxin
VIYGQPAYFSLFRLLYGNLFAKVTEKDTKDWIRVSINVEKSPESLELAFKNDSLFYRDDIRKLAMVNAIRENYFNQEYLKLSMETLLNRVVTNESSRNPEVSGIASSLITSLTKCRTGWKMEPFSLIDHKGDMSENNFSDGKYVYYLFYTTWSTACQKELLMLEKMQESYAGHIRFVTVCMDDDFKEFSKFVKDHPGQKWLSLYGPADPSLRKKVQLRTIPHAILVDPEGKFMYDYTRKPSEGVAKELDIIKSKMVKKDPNASKTWKD